MEIMKWLQMVVFGGFFICLGLYVYFMFLRMKKKEDVDGKLWTVVAAGLLLSIVGQVIGVNTGTYIWENVQFSVITSSVLLLLSLWMIYRKKFAKKKPDSKATKRVTKGSRPAIVNKTKQPKGKKK